VEETVEIVDLRENVAQAIEDAQAELDRALSELERIPALDPTALSLVAHLLGNYMNVLDAMLNLLGRAVGEHPHPDVQVWLDGIRRVMELSQQTVARLWRIPEPADLPLKLEPVPVDVLMERACAYHRRTARQKDIEIVFRTEEGIPAARGDRVALALVADNLLSNAIMLAPPRGRIDVHVAPGPGGVVCSVRNSGEDARAGGGGDRVGTGAMVARTFVSRMSGRLWSEPETGGTSVWFRLPYYREGAAAQ
jgi:signal transduction histidine kinase